MAARQRHRRLLCCEDKEGISVTTKRNPQNRYHKKLKEF